MNRRRIALLAGAAIAAHSPPPAPVLWTPGQLGSATSHWWDSADAATLTLVGTSPVKVSHWASKGSVASATWVQNTDGRRPTYSATARNSLPGLTLDGSDDQMLLSASLLAGGAAISNVFIVAYTSGGATYRGLFGYGTPNGGATGGSRKVGAMNSANTGNAYLDLTAVSVKSASTWGGADRIVAARFESPTTGIRVDGSFTEVTASQVLNTDVSGSACLGNFLDSNPSTYWPGVVQEIVIVNRAVTTDEYSKITGYLAWKWGLQSLLPVDHTYKAAAPLV